MSKNKKKDKKLPKLKLKLTLLLFKEAQRLIYYGNEYKRLNDYGDRMFCGENQTITDEFRAFNEDLNKVICKMEKSEEKCMRYEKLILELKGME